MGFDPKTLASWPRYSAALTALDLALKADDQARATAAAATQALVAAEFELRLARGAVTVEINAAVADEAKA